MIVTIGDNTICIFDENGLNIIDKKKDESEEETEVSMEDIIRAEDFLAKLADNFENLDDCLEKDNIITKVNELVFWLELYEEKTSQCDL